MTSSSVVLGLAEAGEFAAAWVQALARERGIRMLLIKGPALHHHGLRDPRVSADVDALVEPARFGELCAAIVDAGWTQRPSILISELTTLHSKTYIRDGWPCDLDVHSFYPGFLADPAVVFDALWARRMTIELGHVDCDVPDKAGGILVLALHSLRGTRIQTRHVDELERLVRVELTDAEKTDVAALAVATGSVATLETVLPRLGVHVEPPAAELASPELREWRERVAAGSYGAYFWLAAFRSAPWRRRTRIAWRAFWPTRHDLLVARPETVDTVRGRTRARVARWGRGIRSTPGAVRAMTSRRAPSISRDSL